MIDKIIGWFGLVRKSVVEEEVKFDEDSMRDVQELFQKNPVIKDFFSWTIQQDIKRFYSAQDSEHAIIRGAITRTRYFKTLCTPAESGKSGTDKFNIKRYLQ